MSLSFQTKSNTKTDCILRRGYGVLVLLVAVILLYLGCFENVSVSQTRESGEYQTIDAYDYQVLEDAEAPIGICREYKWVLEDIPASGNCFAFYLVHHWAEVSIGGEVVYQLMPQEGNRIGGTIGCNWVMLHLRTADIGKEIKVDLYPIYESVAENDVTFYLGSQMQFCLDQFRMDLPLIILSALAILAGIIFLATTAFDLYLKRKSRNLGYLGLFSIMVGLWKLTDLRTAPLLFAGNPMLLSYITLAMLLTFPVALMLFIRGEFQKRRYPLYDIVCGIVILYGVVVTILQMTGICDFKETLHLTHIAIILFVFSIVSLMVYEWKRGKNDFRMKINMVCFLLCAGGAALDIVSFYFHGNSAGLQFTLTSFLIFVSVKAIFSNRELTKRARMDRHTGLFNKSSCNELIEDEAILEGNASLIMFDLNYLKKVNDTLGHKAGDQMIADFAAILRKTIRISDFVGRYGGDEFIVIAKGAGKENAERILRDMSAAVEKYNAETKNAKISYAAGFAVSVEFENCTMHTLLEKADERMYIHKQEMHREME